MRSATSFRRYIRRATLGALSVACVAGGAMAQPGGGNGDVPGHSAFRPGARLLYADDWATTDIGDIPETIAVAGGTMEIVEENGRRLLKISESASFDLVLSGLLPESYTIDFDMRVPSSTGYAVEIRPDMPNSRPGTAGVSRRMEHPVVLCGAIGAGVYGAGSGSVKRFDDRFANAMVSCEIVVTAKGVKVYYAGQLAANVPGANLGRTRRLRIHVPASQGQEAFLSAVRVGTDAGGQVAAVPSDPATPTEPVLDPATPTADSLQVLPDSGSEPLRIVKDRMDDSSRTTANTRGSATGGSNLRDLPDRVKRRATERAGERLDSAASRMERKIGEGTDKVLDAADTVAAKTLRATDRVVDCLVSDLTCIRQAWKAGTAVKVTDAQGRRVSSADSARAVARAGATNP